MSTRFQPGRAVIVGAAESDLGAVGTGWTALDLMAQGAFRALDDAGLSSRDVDGIFCATTQSRLAGMALAEYLNRPTAYINSPTASLNGKASLFISAAFGFLVSLASEVSGVFTGLQLCRICFVILARIFFEKSVWNLLLFESRNPSNTLPLQGP